MKTKFKDLIGKHPWVKIRQSLIKEYSIGGEELEGYKKVYSSLCLLHEKGFPEEKEELYLYIGRFKDPFNQEDPYVLVSGLDKEYKKGDLRKSLSFLPREEWLSLIIEEKNTKGFSEIEIIAHSLWEMTFLGFEEDQVKRRIKEIEGM